MKFLKKMRKVDMVFFILIAALFTASITIPVRQPAPTPTSRDIEQLQTQIAELRQEMDDVKYVQGYIAWEEEWKRYKEWQANHPN